MKKIAIIGAASGQLPLCKKAAQMGLETYCIAYDKGAVCKDYVDHFIPISIVNMEEVVKVCRNEGIDGIVTNASDLTAEVAAYVSEKLGLNGTPHSVFFKLKNKAFIRRLSQNINEFASIRFYQYEGKDEGLYPCVIKPCIGNSKMGVSYVETQRDFREAIAYASVKGNTDILIEEYVDGKELSIESISFHGQHHIIQITDKDSSGAPHFVELGHHQPAIIPEKIRAKIESAIPSLLTAIGYTDGASHIEVKHNGDDLWLIEANLRGGGDHISNELVQLSSGIDYLECMINVSLNDFKLPNPSHPEMFAGVYFLCKQTGNHLDFFQQASKKKWFVEGRITSLELEEAHSNYEHNGYVIYQSDKKILPYE